jgi:hypothetical protein
MCDAVLRALKERDCQAKILGPTNLNFQNERTIEIFPDKQKQTDFRASGVFK